jgi:hypothetical protein
MVAKVMVVGSDVGVGADAGEGAGSMAVPGVSTRDDDE